ncbi:MAG: sensor protein KdpD [Alphaproteobacteria bacterium]|nr:sensor protein KdpD [Alphaproteobacteria bacterium]
MAKTIVRNLDFKEFIKEKKKGKLKIYIGMIAGVGKTYKLLEEAHALLDLGVDVKIGFVETHRRPETQALIDGLPIIPRKIVRYKGMALEEMDLETIIKISPEVVIVDELAHSNIEGSKNNKRWQDVLELLDAGINVISACNIQHLYNVCKKVEEITGVEIKEIVPKELIAQAYEIVNLDLTADELITRLELGKIYVGQKIPIALNNFFKKENILQLRELALKEVALQLEKKVETEILEYSKIKHECFFACINSNHVTAKKVITETYELAKAGLHKWYVIYIKTPRESTRRINLTSQRHLIENFRYASSLGAQVIKIENNHVLKTIIDQAIEKHVTTICLAKPKLAILKMFLHFRVVLKFIKKLDEHKINLLFISQ